MNCKGHLILGVLISLIFIILLFFFRNWFSNFNLKLLVYIIMLLFISPLVADLDHRHGKLREWFTVIGLVLSLFGIVFSWSNITKFGVIIASISYLLYYTTNHRNFTHSITCTCLYAGFIFWFTKNIELSILGLFSYYTHLIGDKLYFKLY